MLGVISEIRNLYNTIQSLFCYSPSCLVFDLMFWVYFVSEELKLGFEKDGAFPGMQSVALGTKEHNIRARLPAEGLSVENQVDCLLDQAMDPNVLSRVWVGWEPWI